MLEDDIIKTLKDIKDDKKAVLKKWDMGLAFAKEMTERNIVELDEGLCTPTTCRYCEKYVSNGCIGCPIFNKTATFGCRKTPAIKLGQIVVASMLWDYNKEKIIKAIKDEIEFLKEV